MCDPGKKEREHLQRLIERIRSTDKELSQRLDGLLAAEQNLAHTGAVVKGAVEAPDLAGSIVLPETRPAIVVRMDEPVLRPDDTDATIWRTRLQNAMSLVEPVVKAVGRIEMQNHFDSHYAGTGFLVRENVVVTAFHVAHTFARKVNGRPKFRHNLGNQVIEASIDFKEESGIADDETFRIIDVLYLEKEPEIALLQVETVEKAPRDGEPAGLPASVLLSEDGVTVNQDVVTIGYPGKDSTIPDKVTMARLFGTEFEKKRLSPGKISKATETLLKHDCSTLSGSSGSPMVNLDTGRVVGIHLKGQYSVGNTAIPAVRILEALKAIGRA